MKSVAAATTLILAASAFVIPGFGTKRTTEVENVIASKYQARNKPVNLPRNKAPAPKKAATTKPKKVNSKTSSPAQKKPAAAAKPAPAQKKPTTSASDDEKEEMMVEGDEKMVDGDATMEEKTVEGDADKEEALVEHEHVRRAGKPAPKPKTAPKTTANKPKSATKKPAAKPAPAAKKPTSSPSTEDDAEKAAAGDEKIVAADEGMVMKDEKSDEKTVDSDEVAVEGDADKDTDKVEHEHTRRAAKPAAKKPASKPAPKKSAPKPASKKTAPKAATKKAAAKSPAMEKNPVQQIEDVVEKATSTLRARDDAVTPTDVQILQYALTLEHLENAFYQGALEKFSQKAFVQGGLPSFARKRFEQIAEHEASHVAFLTSALGDQAVAPCEYNFPYTDPKSFAALSMILEGVGVSAYLGAAEFIQNKEYLTAAGSILTTEARHASWVAGAVNKQAPWSGAYDTPLSLDEVYSLAAGFITSCPLTNPALPVKAFPQLVVDTKTYKAGDTITLDFDETEANGEPTFLALFSALNTTYAPIENKQATLPIDLEGTVYGVISTSGTAVDDENTIAGVAIFSFYENY